MSDFFTMRSPSAAFRDVAKTHPIEDRHFVRRVLQETGNIFSASSFNAGDPGEELNQKFAMFANTIDHVARSDEARNVIVDALTSIAITAYEQGGTDE